VIKKKSAGKAIKKTAKKERLCFSITGEFVTKTARSWLYEEYRPYTIVLNFLLNCMVGTKLKKATLIKYANDVLTGKRKFIGNTKDDSYCMVDDDTDVLSVYNLYFENIPEPKPEPVVFEDEEEDEINPTIKKIRAYDKILKNEITKDDYGWLDPHGKFTPVGWGNHEAWAREYCGEHFKDVDSDDSFFYPGDFLEKNGWILLHNPCMGAVEIPDYKLERASKKQKEFLYDYFREREMFEEVAAVWKE
jgi:hypothetical protein